VDKCCEELHREIDRLRMALMEIAWNPPISRWEIVQYARQALDDERKEE
jgi:hypothetical protein